jgi:hypothetical protein
MRQHLLKLVIAASCATFVTTAFAASADDYKAAEAKAEGAIKEAHALRNEWTTTTDEMKDAKKAAEAGKFDEAVEHAQEAEALAKASAAQAREQANAWPEAVIR